MATTIKQRQSSLKKKKIILVALLGGVVILGLLLGLEKTGITNFYSSEEAERAVDEEAKTTSNVPTAQPEFSDGGEREPGNTVKENQGSATIVDSAGQLDSTIDMSNPTVSSTGEISLYTPRPTGTIKSGEILAGASTLNKVSYRLIDDVSGVIATGDIVVVNGKFSGTITYSTSAKDGRLDVYSTRPDGSEYSNIEVSIRFN
jgi:hypothetical protein